MKILLQPEARTISDRELEANQQYLIDLINKMRNFTFNWREQVIDKSQKIIP